MEANQYQTTTRELNYKDTTATQKIFALTQRIRAVSGGTGAAKTVGIMTWLTDYCQTKQKRDKLVTVVSESYPHLEKGAMLDFELLMKDRGYWQDNRWNQTKHVYTFETGNKMEFYSVDTYGKAHGPRRDVLFVNEVNNLPYKIVDQLIVRTRETVWMDWNPSEEFWFYTEILNKRKDIDFMGDGGNLLPLTYKDNEALDESSKQEIISHQGNKAWWQVYGEGHLGVITNRIYKDWQIIDAVPHEARLERRGLDFGYSVDYAALVDIYYYNGGYILDERLYRKGMSNKQIADFINNLEPEPQTIVVCDSAEPKSIDELKAYGITALPAIKGPGSISSGIAFIQAQRISATSRSVNLLNEYRRYLWKIDPKTDRTLPDPAPGDDHLMDAIRYAMASLTKPAEFGGVVTVTYH